jgi:hypothetical protein
LRHDYGPNHGAGIKLCTTGKGGQATPSRDASKTHTPWVCTTHGAQIFGTPRLKHVTSHKVWPQFKVEHKIWVRHGRANMHLRLDIPLAKEKYITIKNILQNSK